MKVIGITGSSGAGKSTVCEIIEELYDVCIINADKIAKELSKKGSSYVEGIANIFGKTILTEDGELNRKKLADLIYTDDQKRKMLNGYTFNHIVKKVKKIVETTTKKLVIIDAPLLFEAELDKLCDYTIGIISQKDLQIERICKRDQISKEVAEQRLNIQENNDFFKARCDYIIENNDRIEDIKKQIQNSKLFEI